MDKCFKGTESFFAVYIDDILVFSKNEKDHAKYLERMLKICEDNGLVLSLTKMKIAVSTVYFLGAVIGEGIIKMHRRNEGISSNSSLLSGGSSTVPQCLSEEYEDYLRRSHEDFQPLPRIFTKTIFTPEEPGALYKHYQLKANQTPIKMDKSDAWRSVAQDLELTAAKEAVKAMQNLQAII
ncbi:Orf y [Tanacetum coccineum]